MLRGLGRLRGSGGELALTPAFYPLYLGLCIVVCVLAQERAVVPVRQFLLRRVLKV